MRSHDESRVVPPFGGHQVAVQFFPKTMHANTVSSKRMLAIGRKSVTSVGRTYWATC